MDSKQEITKYIQLIIKVGVGVLSAILMGFAAGLFAERQWHLNGVGILVGVMIGVIIGFIWIYKEVMRIEIDESEK